MEYITFNIALIGDEGVGKSTLLHRHSNGNFKKTYDQTHNFDFHVLKFKTNYPCIVEFTIQDYGGSNENINCEKVDAVIAMFDVTSETTFDNLEYWIGQIPSDKPLIICGNKCDLPNRRVFGKQIREGLKPQMFNTFYYDISAKSNYNYDKPFLKICQILMSKHDLLFVSSDLEGINNSHPPTPDSEDYKRDQINQLVMNAETVLETIYPLIKSLRKDMNRIKQFLKE